MGRTSLLTRLGWLEFVQTFIPRDFGNCENTVQIENIHGLDYISAGYDITL